MEENNNEKISVSGADLLKDVVADEKAAKTAPKDTEKDKKDKDKKKDKKEKKTGRNGYSLAATPCLSFWLFFFRIVPFI